MAVNGSTRGRFVLLASFAAAALALAGARGASPATGAAPSACPSSTRDAYAMTAGALTGPTRTDLGVVFTTAPGCTAVSLVKHLQIKWFDEDGDLAGVRNLDNLHAEDAVATVQLQRIARGRRVEADALVQTGIPVRTYVVRARTTTRFRPDLAVTTLHAPAQTLTTRPVDVTAEVRELKGDTGATALVVLADSVGALADPLPVTVPPGGSASVTFPHVALATATQVDLKVLVTAAAPGEYDTANNAADTTVDVTNNELAPLSVLLQSLGGYGMQFNGHLYAPITNPPPATLPDLEAKVKALEPQFVRIFFNENWELNADKKHPEWEQNLQSFRDVVQLADEAGATITIAYQTIATAKNKPDDWMTRFADVLQGLVRDDKITNLRWVSIANEPNSTALTLPQYEALYRALDAQLQTRGLRDQIGLIGGDLVQSTENTASGHRAWFDYMVTHMNDVIDAWSEHIYWNYWDHFRMEERLKDVAHLVHSELPASAQKPTFIMEFGVRGANTCGTKPTVTAAYYQNPPDCTELRRMSLAGFQKVWFTIDAAQLGFDAASDWDLYWSMYDGGGKTQQSYWTIGPPEEGWALYPSYYAFQMLFQTTTRGWQVLEVDPWAADDQATRYDDPHPDQAEQELTAYSGPDGQLTVAGLDTHGGALTAPSGETSSYSIGGLPASTTFTLVIWNADGNGTNSIAGPVVTNDAGVARFDVPMQGAFVLTTVPVS